MPISNHKRLCKSRKQKYDKFPAIGVNLYVIDPRVWHNQNKLTSMNSKSSIQIRSSLKLYMYSKGPAIEDTIRDLPECDFLGSG